MLHLPGHARGRDPELSEVRGPAVLSLLQGVSRLSRVQGELPREPAKEEQVGGEVGGEGEEGEASVREELCQISQVTTGGPLVNEPI